MNWVRSAIQVRALNGWDQQFRWALNWMRSAIQVRALNWVRSARWEHWIGWDKHWINPLRKFHAYTKIFSHLFDNQNAGTSSTLLFVKCGFGTHCCVAKMKNIQLYRKTHRRSQREHGTEYNLFHGDDNTILKSIHWYRCGKLPALAWRTPQVSRGPKPSRAQTMRATPRCRIW